MLNMWQIIRHISRYMFQTSDPKPATLLKFLVEFHQLIQIWGNNLKLGDDRFLPHCFPIHCSLIVVAFDDVQSDIVPMFNWAPRQQCIGLLRSWVSAAHILNREEVSGQLHAPIPLTPDREVPMLIKQGLRGLRARCEGLVKRKFLPFSNNKPRLLNFLGLAQ